MAEQVCADQAIPADAVLGLQISLIDKSLVVLDGEAAGDARYRLLDTIREYAAERLAEAGEPTELSLRHRDCVLALVEDTARGMSASRWPPSLAHGHTEQGLRLCAGLRNMWVPHGDAREAATWLDRFLAEGREMTVEDAAGYALGSRTEPPRPGACASGAPAATAARHVANILAKLGFSSRTQVASWAARHEPPS